MVLKMKHDHLFDIRETVARALPGRDPTRAYRFLRWLDYNGYAIVAKETLHGEATLAPRSSENSPAAAQDKLLTPP
jgi:hypothetical protein